MNTRDLSQYVFISRIQMAQNPEANERLRVMPQEDWEYDSRTQVYWVRHGSRTHNLAILCGIEPYHKNDDWLQGISGTWDRHGRIR